MYLEIVKIKNKTYLYKTTSIRKDNKQAKSRVKLGELSHLKELLKDITDDPIKYYKQIFEEENIKAKQDKFENISFKI